MTQVQTTVYYLTHRDTGLRRGWYRTLAGARIAQRQRNRGLGFTERVERVEQFSNWEVELCRLRDGTVIEATWCIVEGCVEICDLEQGPASEIGAQGPAAGCDTKISNRWI